MKHRFLACLALAAAGSAFAQAAALKTADIRVRDPFIYADKKTATYYLYAQAGNRENSGFQGVEVYTSTNLTEWTPPKPVLTLPAGSGVAMVWAPEMHAYNGRLLLALHQPNTGPLERLRLVELEDDGTTLRTCD